jgi:LPS export ABC transporter protein LptC
LKRRFNIPQKLVFPAVLAGFAIFISCENDIEKVNQITRTSDMASMIVNDIETVYSDSGIVKVNLTAPKLLRYEKSENSYDEYPAGLTVNFYDDNLNITGSLTCEYAKYFVEDNLWDARKNVEAKNINTGEQLNTEKLFWDIEKELIYSDAFVRITTQDEVLLGNGFESDQDFSKWKILNPKGTININEDE